MVVDDRFRELSEADRLAQKFFAATTFSYLQRDDISGVVLLGCSERIPGLALGQALSLQNLDKPVVFTGAMVPYDQHVEHVRRHLEDSIRVAGYSGLKEVVVCFTGDEDMSHSVILRGAGAHKTNWWGYTAFSSPTDAPIGTVRNGGITINASYGAPERDGECTLLEERCWQIATINVTLGSLGMLQVPAAFRSGGAKGIVLDLEGEACGGCSTTYAFVKDNLEAGIPVAIRTPGYTNAELGLTAEDKELKELGAIPMGVMPPEKVTAKLGWVLPQTDGTPKQVQEMMQRNYAGEMNGLFRR